MGLDDEFMKHKAAEQADAEDVTRPAAKVITGRFEIFVPADHPDVEEALRQIEGIDEIFKTRTHQVGREPNFVEYQHTVYSFDVEDAFELGPRVKNAVDQIRELLGVGDIYVVWHAVTGVRW